jgi:LPXTG-site transpeptidase (sortase) family protein
MSIARRARRAAATLLAIFVVAAGELWVLKVVSPASGVASGASRRPAVVVRSALVADVGAGGGAAAPVPVRVRVDGAGIDGPVVPVGVTPGTDAMAVVPDPAVVGWYEYGPRPGDGGSAVLAGHLDWNRRAGVFARLGKVQVGQVVTVTYADHAVGTFRVIDTRLVDKAALPDDLFARDGAARLRLVTCGGSFDRLRHHYRGNLVVTAVPVS